MQETLKTKVVREHSPARLDTPADYLRRANALIQEMEVLNPFPRPRGFVKCFRTHDDYEVWKKSQGNPRLW